MFLGEYKHSIDAKGRVTIPARYRQLLSEGAYITQGLDRNLMVVRSYIFEGYIEKLNRVSLTDDNARKLRRFLFSKAEQIEPDSNGRILIPTFLRETVNLTGEVMLIGNGSYFELWSAETWEEQLEKMEEAQDDADYFSAIDLIIDEEKA